MVGHVLFGIFGLDGRVVPDIHSPLIEAREPLLWSIKDPEDDDFTSKDQNVGDGPSDSCTMPAHHFRSAKYLSFQRTPSLC
jgi:hypothetical protein